MAAKGFVRARVDGEIVDLVPTPSLDKRFKHDVDIVVDRLVVRADGENERLTDSVETGLREGEGRLVVAPVARRGEEAAPELLFSEKRACDYCHLSFPELSPQLFSFNSPLGMCPECNGLGTALRVDPERVVPNPDLSLAEGALEAWPSGSGEGAWTQEILRGVADGHGISMTTPWRKLREKDRDVILYGSEQRVTVRYDRPGRGKGTWETNYEGVANRVLRLFRETQSESMRKYYGAFLASAPCPSCGGSRLRPEATAVQVAGETLPGLSSRSVDGLRRFFTETRFEGATAAIADDLVREIEARLRFLDNVGLGYLSLDRGGASLSGGEAQRIRLASQIGSELTGVLYILDEPSIGLHPRDNLRLVEALEALRDIGNTVLVVEHDESMMRAADYLVDFGPGAGRAGGELLYAGPPEGIVHEARSLTGRYLSGALGIPWRRERRLASHALRLRGSARQQPPVHRRALSTGGLHGRQRRVGRGEELARERDALSIARPAPQPRRPGHRRLRPCRRSRAPRQGHQHRSEAHRAHAALQPGHLHEALRSDPRGLREDP